MRNLVLAALAMIVMAGCGSGGNASANTVVEKAKFVTTDFSGKPVYFVDGQTYQLYVFADNGHVFASGQLTSGAPTAGDVKPVGAWYMVGEELIVSGSGIVTGYILIDQDTANRYYKALKYAADGTVSTVGMFYDLSTNLNQAQGFVAQNRAPETGPAGSPCDGVDTTTRPPDFTTSYVANNRVVISNTWGACTK